MEVFFEEALEEVLQQQAWEESQDQFLHDMQEWGTSDKEREDDSKTSGSFIVLSSFLFCFI